MTRNLFDKVALLALVFLALPGLATAETVIYDEGEEPLLSITYPEGWLIDTNYIADAKAAGTYTGGEPEIRIVEAMPDDGTRLWIGIWVAPRVPNLEKGLEYLDSLDSSLFTDIEVTDPKDEELGGMPAKTLKGSAKRQGEDVELAMALLQAKPDVVVAVLYVGALDTWANHEDELNAIVGSLKPAGS